jgi:signal transduction histidine kinase
MAPTLNKTALTSTGEEFAAAVEAAKLQALYNLAYGLSHEINNPLANIATRAQTLLLEERDPDRRRKLATINQQAFRAHEMIADLMLFARPPAPRLEAVDLVKLADTVVAELADQAREQDTTLVRSGLADPLVAQVDPTQISVALRALVQNSLEALKTGGRVEVTVSAQHEAPSNRPVPPPHFVPTPNSALRTPHLFLSVSDTGPGIPPEIRPQIFDPFFSGREAGRGLGLGLSKAWRIVQLHGGTITVDSPVGGGATFVVTLPAERVG